MKIVINIIVILFFLVHCNSQNKYFYESSLNKIVESVQSELSHHEKQVFLFERNDSVVIVKIDGDKVFMPGLIREKKGCFLVNGAKFFVMQKVDSTKKSFLNIVNNQFCKQDVFRTHDSVNGMNGYIYKRDKKNKFVKIYEGSLFFFFNKSEYQLKRINVSEPPSPIMLLDRNVLEQKD